MVLAIIAVECATLFIIFAPVVPESVVPFSCPYGYTCPRVDFYGSILFHYFSVGMVYFACNGFQKVKSASGSPIMCYTGVKIQSTQTG